METYILEYEGKKAVIDQYPRDQIEELKERVRLGNQKLKDAWDVLRKLELSDHWKAELERWHLANVKLSEYCSQLKRLGFRDCLYKDENGVKYKGCLEPLGCCVCPSDISYWEKELMSLPGASKEKK